MSLPLDMEEAIRLLHPLLQRYVRTAFIQAGAAHAWAMIAAWTCPGDLS